MIKSHTSKSQAARADRSQAIRDAVREKLARMKRSRLSLECAKLDPKFEKAMTDDEKNKVQLKYPCPWVYKIIGPDAVAMQLAVTEIIRDRAYKVSPSRSSEKNKYHCLNVELSVESESHRMALYEALKAHRAVKLVL